jgi:hypothetical protein
MSKSIITPFLALQNQLKIWHWLTSSYAQHKAFGDTYDLLDDSIDEFIEVFVGRYSRDKLVAVSNLEVTVQMYLGTDIGNAINEIDTFIDDFLYNTVNAIINTTDTDLLNIRDTIAGQLNRLKYLLTLS